MDEEVRKYWTNEKTGEIDFRNTPTTDEDAVQYIPQIPSAQNLYACYRESGLPILEAMVNVLSVATGSPAPFSVK